jgi:hypothetical protein
VSIRVHPWLAKLAAETGWQQNPRPGRKSRVAQGRVAGGADLGTPTSKAEGKTSNIQHSTSNIESKAKEWTEQGCTADLAGFEPLIFTHLSSVAS